MIFWSHRLFLATGDARYLDVVERALYNGFLAGVSLSGDKFFYVNPLASRGNHHRQPWHGCTCCPTNIVRFFPTLGQYVYASTDDTVYVNLYAAGSGKVKLGSRTVTVSQETRYPWDGAVKLTVSPAEPQEFVLALADTRLVPRGIDARRNVPVERAELKPTLKVNGAPFDAGAWEAGFARIRRLWKPGDVVELDIPMPIQRIYANRRVRANVGRVAFQRGPIVYCVEGARPRRERRRPGAAARGPVDRRVPARAAGRLDGHHRQGPALARRRRRRAGCADGHPLLRLGSSRPRRDGRLADRTAFGLRADTDGSVGRLELHARLLRRTRCRCGTTSGPR